MRLTVSVVVACLASGIALGGVTRHELAPYDRVSSVVCMSSDRTKVALSIERTIAPDAVERFAIWDIGNSLTFIPLPESREARVQGMSADGQRVIMTSDGLDGRRAYLWDQDQGFLRIGPTTGTSQCAAGAISPSGRFVTTTNGSTTWVQEVTPGASVPGPFSVLPGTGAQAGLVDFGRWSGLLR
jgi:hypothetical protein